MGEEEEEEEEEGEKCVRAFMRQLCIFFFFVSLPYICCTIPLRTSFAKLVSTFTFRS